MLVGCIPVLIVLALLIAALVGCDAGSPAGEGHNRDDLDAAAVQAGSAGGPAFAASSACDDTCNADLCEAVVDDRNDYAESGRWCFKDCADAMLECMLEPDSPIGCGTCEHRFAECRTECLGLIEECHAEWSNDTCAQGWDHWCHLVIASSGDDCEAGCNAASLGCIEDDETCGGECFAAAADCRAGCA